MYFFIPVQVQANNYSQHEALIGLTNLINSFDTNDASTVWPSFSVSSVPTLAHFNGAPLFLYNMDSNDLNWHEQSILGRRVLKSDIDFLNVSNISLHWYFPYENYPVYLFNLNLIGNNINYKTFVVFIHERFHRYQLENFVGFMDFGKQYNKHFDFNNVALTQLENILLKKYVHNWNEQLIKDFSIVNHYRESMLDAESKKWEHYQQLVEGTAEYIQTKTFQVFPNLIDHNISETFIDRINDNLSNNELIDKVIKWRNYSVGGALCFALEHLQYPNWKLEIEKSTNTLNNLIYNHFSFEQNYENERIKYLKEVYDFEQIKRTTIKEITKYKKQIQEIMDEYNNMVGAEFNIYMPLGSSAGGSSEQTYYLANGGTLGVNKQQFSTTEDGSINLSYQTPIAFSYQDGKTVFKMINVNKLFIDGKEYFTNELERTEFFDLSISSPNFNFNVQKRNGVISKDNNSITIKFFNN